LEDKFEEENKFFIGVRSFLGLLFADALVIAFGVVKCDDCPRLGEVTGVEQFTILGTGSKSQSSEADEPFFRCALINDLI
jgi:hypothetical protein